MAGALTRSFDGMIDRLEQAFRRSASSRRMLRTSCAPPLDPADGDRGGTAQSSEYRASIENYLRYSSRKPFASSKLVEDMLALARIDAGYRLEFRVIALDDLVLSAADRLLPLMEQRGLTLHVDRLDSVVVLGEPDGSLRSCWRWCRMLRNTHRVEV